MKAKASDAYSPIDGRSLQARLCAQTLPAVPGLVQRQLARERCRDIGYGCRLWEESGIVLDWERRTITLFADRARASEIVAEWEAHGWKVLGVDHHENAAAPTVTVTVAVPPVDSA